MIILYVRSSKHGRYHFLEGVNIKMAVFWNIHHSVSEKLPDVSEVSAACMAQLPT
jgi:hypothetical protein